ncbi:unnamed protein product [Chilo suppressalis]|uniref:Uncharacterized protein n=1 Tax=Chilo suppressalis TaxID=168631 RepID=A0ABN8LA32_CHISP|nr:unnamed protein product [Chilo suppressalis]
MDALVDSMVDFVRTRQLNIAVAGLLTLIYLAYQYWGIVFKAQGVGDELDCHHTTRLSRSRSRSASRSRTRAGHYDYKLDDKHGRRRKRRCPDCSLCNFEE